MQELKVFKQQEVLGKDFKIYGTMENPLFLAKDVAEWIEHSNSRMMLQSVDDGEKQCVNNPYALKGQREQWFLTEDGLYEILMQSRKPIAKEFKKQVKIILKQIRQTGGAVVEDREEEFISNYFPSFSEAVKLAMVQDLRKQNSDFKKQIEEQKPKVLFAEAVESSKTSILVGDLAKLLKQNGVDIGQRRLFQWLRESNYLIKRGSSKNMPTQTSMDKGLFDVKESVIINSDDSIRITKTTKVTGKGQQYFINKFLQQPLAV